MAIIRFVFLSSALTGSRSAFNTEPKAVAFLGSLDLPWRKRLVPARVASGVALVAASAAQATAESGLTDALVIPACSAASPAAAAAPPAAAAPAGSVLAAARPVAAAGAAGSSLANGTVCEAPLDLAGMGVFVAGLSAEEVRSLRVAVHRRECTDGAWDTCMRFCLSCSSAYICA